MKYTMSNNNQEKSIIIVNNILFPVVMVILLAAVLMVTITGITGSKVFPQEENTTMLRDNFSKNFNDSSTMQNATLAFAQEDSMLPPMQSQTPTQLKNDSSSAMVDNDTANNNSEVSTDEEQRSSTLTQNIKLLQFETEPDDRNYLEESDEFFDFE